MAITFAEKEKRQKNLVFVFIVAVFVAVLIFYFGYFLKKEKPQPAETKPVVLPQKVEINFEFLKNPIFGELQVFEKIGPAKPEEIGRKDPDNPFINY